MNEFDQQLKKSLNNRGHFDPQKSDNLKKEVIQMFDKKLMIVKLITWGFHIFFVIVMLFAFWQLDRAMSTKGMLLNAIVIIMTGATVQDFEASALGKTAISSISLFLDKPPLLCPIIAPEIVNVGSGESFAAIYHILLTQPQTKLG